MSRSRRQGVTLIELMVVLFIVLVIALVAMPAIQNWIGGDVRSSARKIGSTLQMAYDECAIQHVPMRVAYNLDQRTYWVEIANGDVALFQNQAAREKWSDEEEDRQEENEEWDERDQQDRERMRQQQESAIGDAEEEGMFGGLMGMLGVSLGTGTLEPAQRINQFEAMEDEVFKIRQLPNNVAFMGVWSPQFDDVAEPQDPPPEEEEEELIVYTHIFPEGYMEDTVVYLVDRREMVISLIVEPLTGRVRAEVGEADPPRREARNVD